MVIIDNVLDKLNCEMFEKYIKFKLNSDKKRNIANMPWHESDTIASNQVDNFYRSKYNSIRYLIGQHVCMYANQPVFPHYTDLVMWVAGRSMGLHVDNGVGESDPRDSYLKNRHYSCILYLNSDYEGGETFFENTSVKPEVGRLVVFPSSILHGVTKVESGIRCTFAMWFTKNFAQIEY